jgi:hypothetical protein
LEASSDPLEFGVSPVNFGLEYDLLGPGVQFTRRYALAPILKNFKSHVLGNLAISLALVTDFASGNPALREPDLPKGVSDPFQPSLS